MYEPLETSKCKKCGKIIAEPKELIRIVKENEKMTEKESDEDLQRKLDKIQKNLVEKRVLDAEASRRYGVAQEKLAGWLIELIESQRDKLKEKSKMGFFLGILIRIQDLRNQVLMEILREEQHKNVPELVLIKKMKEALEGIGDDLSDFLVKEGTKSPSLPSLPSEPLYPIEALYELTLCLGQLQAYVLGVLFELV
jgi:hypothetical protein